MTRCKTLIFMTTDVVGNTNLVCREVHDGSHSYALAHSKHNKINFCSIIKKVAHNSFITKFPLFVRRIDSNLGHFECDFYLMCSCAHKNCLSAFSVFQSHGAECRALSKRVVMCANFCRNYERCIRSWESEMQLPLSSTFLLQPCYTRMMTFFESDRMNRPLDSAEFARKHIINLQRKKNWMTHRIVALQRCVWLRGGFVCFFFFFEF